MAQKKLQGHFCKVCGMWKSNESFSGKGHKTNICSECSHLLPAQQAEQITLRRLENLPLRRLTKNERAWLKKRTHDHRPGVKAMACMVYSERFPLSARNQKKKELSIQTLTLSIDGEIYDHIGDSVYLKESYQVSRTPPTIVRTRQDATRQTMTPPSKIMEKLLKRAVHILDIFWWEEDYSCSVDALSVEDGPFLWSVHVEYKNGEVQDTRSTEYPPDPVLELLFSLAEFFG